MSGDGVQAGGIEAAMVTTTSDHPRSKAATLLLAMICLRRINITKREVLAAVSK